jgi:hypothetical protein
LQSNKVTIFFIYYIRCWKSHKKWWWASNTQKTLIQILIICLTDFIGAAAAAQVLNLNCPRHIDFFWRACENNKDITGGRMATTLLYYL